MVRPLLKKRGLDCENLRNYRPVSGLPFLSKAIERAVALQLTRHLNIFGNFDPQQSAYRRHHSFESVVTRVLDAAFKVTDTKMLTVLTLLDLPILLKKLEACGWLVLPWTGSERFSLAVGNQW